MIGPRAIPQTAALAVKELKVLLRDRQALLLLFLMPAVFIFFLSLALRDVFNEKVGGTMPITLTLEDEGAAAARVVARLRARPELAIVTPAAGARTSDRELFASGEARAAITIPEGFTKDLDAWVAARGREPFGAHRIVWDADPTLDAAYRWFLKASLGAAIQGAILDGLAQPRGATPTTPAKSASTADSSAAVPAAGDHAAGDPAADAGTPDIPAPLDTDAFLAAAPQPAESRIIPTPLQQTVPGWSLFAMFFIVVPLSGSFLRERAEGTLRRLHTYPVPRTAIVLGKLLPYVGVNVLQFAAMLAIGLFIVPLLGDFRLQLGAHPAHLVAVTLAAAFAATGFGALVASVSRTIEQASALGATAVVVMAVAGGIMVPVFIMPRPMRSGALASPLYWGHQAYLDVMLRDAPFATLAPKLAILVGFAVVFLTLASWRTRREW